MPDQTAHWQKQGHVYVVTAPSVGSAAQGTAVVAALKAAFADWFADGTLYEFNHQILVGNIPSEGLPVPDEAALHEDMRSGAGIADYMRSALQPGWFWLHLATLENGKSVIADWLDAVKQAFADKAAETPHATGIWEVGDVGLQLGESALMPLALQDPFWLDAYTDMLPLWDLGHEVNQRPTISTLFKTHGWSDAMRRLLVVRASVDGQHGPEQVFGDLRDAIAAATTPEEFTAFYRDALMALRTQIRPFMDWPLQEKTLRNFSITGPLADIVNTLPDDTGDTDA